jgi:hypothetical protein
MSARFLRPKDATGLGVQYLNLVGICENNRLPSFIKLAVAMSALNFASLVQLRVTISASRIYHSAC